MESLFVDGKDGLTVLREAKRRKHEWEARMQVRLAEMQRQMDESRARYDAFSKNKPS